MHPNFVKELLRKPEGVKLEFKEEVNLDDKYQMADFLRHFLSLTNSIGGVAYLVIGVQDKTGEITGLQVGHGLTEERLQQIVRRYCTPPISFTFEVSYLNNLPLGILTIPPSKLKPHYLSEDIAGRIRHADGKEKEWKFPRERIYTRRGSITDEASIHDIDQMRYEVNPQQHSTESSIVIPLNPAKALSSFVNSITSAMESLINYIYSSVLKLIDDFFCTHIGVHLFIAGVIYLYIRGQQNISPDITGWLGVVSATCWVLVRMVYLYNKEIRFLKAQIQNQDKFNKQVYDWSNSVDKWMEENGTAGSTQPENENT